MGTHHATSGRSARARRFLATRTEARPDRRMDRWERLDPRLLVAALAFVGLVAIVQTARIVLGRALRGARLRRQGARARAGEASAEALVGALGYAVLGRQVASEWGVCVADAHGTPGEARREARVRLRADLVVERGGRRYVAEVKTGRAAPRIDSAATRRQLLEYRVAFDVDGVLLVDAEARAVHEIEFALPAGARVSPVRTRLSAAVAGLVVGFALAALWLFVASRR
jgi:hypothetical protein